MSPSPHRVLIVDDEPAVRDLIALVVATGGREPVRVGSVPEALDELERRPVELVVTDLDMPVGGGLDLLAELSSRPSAPPSLVVTGTGDESALRAASLLGAREVIGKPFGFFELRRAVERILMPPPRAVLAA
jgi:CheY-like chemotaxis protein